LAQLQDHYLDYPVTNAASASTTHRHSAGIDMEKRQFTRVAFDAPALIEQDGHRWQTTVLDLSLKGILLKSTLQAPLNADKPLLITITLAPDCDINMHTHWVHSNGGNSGLRCDSIDLDSITHLRRLVELNLGDEGVLERELTHLA
jgi:hypothetical protein